MIRAFSKGMSRASDHIWRSTRRSGGVRIRPVMSNSLLALRKIRLRSGHSNAYRYIAVRISAGSVRKGFSEL